MMSSLFIGASGMQSHAEGMSVVSHNLANVNTVGYKQQSMLYSDLISQYQTTSSSTLTNVSQVGMGSAPGSVRTLFTEGGYESGSESTDIGIVGLGFFGVTKNNMTEYTRAGNFRFTKEGALVDPSGWTLLGHSILNGVESRDVSPVQLDMSSKGAAAFMPPKATSAITAASQLGGLKDKSVDAANPFFAMTSKWDGTATPPLAAGNYSYSEGISFFDSEGNSRSARIYYDLAGKSGGQTAVEYVVAFDPTEDASGFAGTKNAGLLMAGTMSFSSSGYLQNVTAFSPPASGNPSDLSGWTPAALTNGNPTFSVTPKGGATQAIALNMGLTLSGSASSGLASAAAAAGDPAAVFGANSSAKLTQPASTAFGTTCSSISQTRDGYAPGSLREITVSSDGVMTGSYSNGESQDLFRISLYRFTSQDGLRREGNNHYSATADSGAAQEGKPGSENFGTLASYSLEQSNVDYAREFSTMIITQRGFQMNSKVVTTSDQMLQKALELKRS